MTCSTCANFAATSTKQLQNRRRVINTFIDAVPFTCPQCGMNDWALTEAHLLEPPDKPKFTWFHFWAGFLVVIVFVAIFG